MRQAIACSRTKKAPITGAFLFVCFLPLLFASSTLRAATLCEPVGTSQSVKIATVFDGDTVLLSDKRRVRVLGINTPELARHGRADQPFARQAKQALERLIHNKSVRLFTESRRYDRYDRVLGHLQLGDGRLVSRQLLLAGLGWHAEVAPATTLEQCLALAEQRARQQKQGIWARGGWQPVKALQTGSGGFKVLRGRVTLVQPGRRGKASWLELDDSLAVRIPAPLARQLSLSRLMGKTIEVRGWVVDRQRGGKRLKPSYKRWMLTLGSRRMLNDSVGAIQ